MDAANGQVSDDGLKKKGREINTIAYASCAAILDACSVGLALKTDGDRFSAVWIQVRVLSRVARCIIKELMSKGDYCRVVRVPPTTGA